MRIIDSWQYITTSGAKAKKKKFSVYSELTYYKVRYIHVE